MGDLLVIMSTILLHHLFYIGKTINAKVSHYGCDEMGFTFGFIMILPLGWNEFTQIPWSLYQFVNTFFCSWSLSPALSQLTFLMCME